MSLAPTAFNILRQLDNRPDLRCLKAGIGRGIEERRSGKCNGLEEDIEESVGRMWKGSLGCNPPFLSKSLQYPAGV